MRCGFIRQEVWILTHSVFSIQIDIIEFYRHYYDSTVYILLNTSKLEA